MLFPDIESINPYNRIALIFCKFASFAKINTEHGVQRSLVDKINLQGAGSDLIFLTDHFNYLYCLLVMIG
ncbi:hypothetical protein BFG52_05990 [Acinetobacter larvae]|uniref:Uncharacterized protein n=1 Tax=Acinetobacter larvae TaxID=1789224 RepID=A0A1B2LYT8_9GAMM|nr:hypothetical protein BFG52_05990 [Acinetobacter larvae]